MQLLSLVTTNQTSPVARLGKGRRTIRAAIYGTSGTVSATVTFYGNNDNDFASAIALTDPILLSGTGTGTVTPADKAGSDMPSEWQFVWANAASITGTGAAVTASVGA
jgi:hypothetical protein